MSALFGRQPRDLGAAFYALLHAVWAARFRVDVPRRPQHVPNYLAANVATCDAVAAAASAPILVMRQLPVFKDGYTGHYLIK